MGWLRALLGGSGRLKPGRRAVLEAEGLVLLEEDLAAALRYHRFKAPGRRFHGKVTYERVAVGISEARLAVYCRSGWVKLIDTPFSEPRMAALTVSLEDPGTVAILIDFDRIESPKVSGQMTIAVSTPAAPRIAEELQRRLPS